MAPACCSRSPLFQKEKQTQSPVVVGGHGVVKAQHFRAVTDEGGRVGQAREVYVQNGAHYVMVESFA